MKTERDIPLIEPAVANEPYPKRVRDLGRQICELKARIASTIAIFREALKEFSGQWMREMAKKVAIAQNQHTLQIGRGEIARLKRTIEEHLGSLDETIADEFSPERYGDAAAASSGQVNALVERRFEQGIRRVLATLNPILERAGYSRDDSWVVAEPVDGTRGRYSHAVELPPDLIDQIGKVAEAITDMKVAEAKIAYYDRQRDKERAAEAWDNA